MSIPAFEAACKPYALGRSVAFTWLPLPSTVPVGATAAGIAEVRRRYLTNGQSLVGHFGTFGRQTKPLLDAIIPRLLHDCSKVALLLIGPGGEAFRSLLLERYPAYSTRIHCAGQIDASDPRLSCHLSACDLMIQPYPDGVTTRRTSIMAPLSHGVPAVTTSGRQTEPFWRDCGALALAPVGDTEAFVRTAQELIEDQEKRTRISTAATSLYHRTFDIQEIVATLRGGQSDFAPEPRVPASDKVRVVDRC
jgi:glycosyltransferase involved in cell wall biosynthesis